jgi:parvulin-like peptidyl-prolyl isomerase
MLASFALAACDEPTKPAPTPSATASAASASSASPPASQEPAATATSPASPPTEITAQHVLVAYKGAQRAPKSVTRSRGDAKTRAEEVASKAKAGQDFTELVKQYSDDPEAQSRLGSLGKFGRDKFDKAFTDAAFALKVGETSGVVETPFGFHVLRRNQ